jgi:hypothetical protein
MGERKNLKRLLIVRIGTPAVQQHGRGTGAPHSRKAAWRIRLYITVRETAVVSAPLPDVAVTTME